LAGKVLKDQAVTPAADEALVVAGYVGLIRKVT